MIEVREFVSIVDKKGDRGRGGAVGFRRLIAILSRSRTGS